MVTLYTTHCPKCRVVEKKLNMAGIEFNTSQDIQKLVRLGYSSAPILEIEDGTMLKFKDACHWVDAQQKGQ